MTTSLKSAEDYLLDQWHDVHVQADYMNFIADGIVDHESFKRQPVKVLILLREANWIRKEGEAFNQDLRTELRRGAPDKANWRNWHVVARWIYLLTESHSLEWPVLRRRSVYDIPFRKAQFQKTAIVNVKKVGGGSYLGTTGWKKIIAYCDRHRDLIHEQIRLCSPSVIICSGTFGLLLDHVDMRKTTGPIESFKNGVRWCRYGNETTIALEMPHFGARGKGYSHQSLHDRIASIRNEIWNVSNSSPENTLMP